MPSRSRINIPNEELFANLEHIWLTLGRQPKYSEIEKPLYLFSVDTYEQRFGSWYNALDAFVLYMSNEDSDTKPNVETNKEGIKHYTKRDKVTKNLFETLFQRGFLIFGPIPKTRKYLSKYLRESTIKFCVLLNSNQCRNIILLNHKIVEQNYEFFVIFCYI